MIINRIKIVCEVCGQDARNYICDYITDERFLPLPGKVPIATHWFCDEHVREPEELGKLGPIGTISLDDCFEDTNTFCTETPVPGSPKEIRGTIFGKLRRPN